MSLPTNDVEANEINYNDPGPISKLKMIISSDDSTTLVGSILAGVFSTCRPDLIRRAADLVEEITPRMEIPKLEDEAKALKSPFKSRKRLAHLFGLLDSAKAGCSARDLCSGHFCIGDKEEELARLLQDILDEILGNEINRGNNEYKELRCNPNFVRLSNRYQSSPRKPRRSQNSIFSSRASKGSDAQAANECRSEVQRHESPCLEEPHAFVKASPDFPSRFSSASSGLQVLGCGEPLSIISPSNSSQQKITPTLLSASSDRCVSNCTKHCAESKYCEEPELCSLAQNLRDSSGCAKDKPMIKPRRSSSPDNPRRICRGCLPIASHRVFPDIPAPPPSIDKQFIQKTTKFPLQENDPSSNALHSTAVISAQQVSSSRPAPSTHHKDTAKVPQLNQSDPAKIKTPARIRRMKNVSFDKVHVREYEQILTGNSCCFSGPSVALGWKYEIQGFMDIEKWENIRSGHRRFGSELLMSKSQRNQMVYEMGLFKTDVIENIQESQKTKRERGRAVNSSKTEKLETALKKTRAKVTNIYQAAAKRQIK